MVFETDDDRLVFLKRLGETCNSCGWRVHAWVLIGNHFHLLLETPQPNLVAGMKWLLGVFSQGWNRARGRRGHVFQERYKSVPVNGSNADSHYFRIVADYIHLNPARARLAELAQLRKGDKSKALLATLLRRRMAVGFEWIATRLHLGHSASVSRLVCGVKRDKKLEKKVNELDQLFQGAD